MSSQAINGLLVCNDHINVISNNIANASTIGYKSVQPFFSDIFCRSLSSSINKGFGVAISGMMQNFTDGALIQTNRELDLGITNNGFFRVLDAIGHVYYTRNGQFLLDKEKNIINMQGMYLTGKNKYFAKNTFFDDVEPINLKNAYKLKAQPTSLIQFSAILNKNMDLNRDSSDDDLSKPQKYNSYITIYDKNAQPEKINISFDRTNINSWKVNVQSTEPDYGDNSEKSINSTFELQFNSNGELISEKNFKIVSQDGKYEDINLDLTNTVQQSESNNSWERYSQNGYEKGSLQNFEILPNGEIIGTYSNQQMQSIGQILLSNFIRPEKLQPESGNIWSSTAEAGPESVGTAGDPGFGILSSKNLESSNVDLNKELINMIVAQRNYQSNAQSFKVEDKIINTLINLR